MKIRCDNGLCDRLRFIFSYWHGLGNCPLSVCWMINKKCNGHFLDVFQPIAGIEITDDASNVDVRGWEPYDNLGLYSNTTQTNIYQLLIPVPAIQDRLSKIRQALGTYVAIHIRRTDKAIRNNMLTSDEEFIDYANLTRHNIFLATDCYHVQNKFKKIYGDRLFWVEDIGQPWVYQLEDCDTYGRECPDFRPLSLASTVLDMFTCICSYDFMGTNYSGMSDFIHYNRAFFGKDLYI